MLHHVRLTQVLDSHCTLGGVPRQGVVLTDSVSLSHVSRLIVNKPLSRSVSLRDRGLSLRDTRSERNRELSLRDTRRARVSTAVRGALRVTRAHTRSDTRSDTRSVSLCLYRSTGLTLKSALNVMYPPPHMTCMYPPPHRTHSVKRTTTKCQTSTPTLSLACRFILRHDGTPMAPTPVGQPHGDVKSST